MNTLGIDLLNVAIGIVLILIILLTGYFLFSKVTRYDDGKEIRGGNEAAGMYMGSKLLGLCIIVGMVSLSSHSWIDMIIWSVVGIVVLIVVYLIFDFVTPNIKVCKEIEQGNMAVAQLLRSIIIGVSFVIGTFLM